MLKQHTTLILRNLFLQVSDYFAFSEEKPQNFQNLYYTSDERKKQRKKNKKPCFDAAIGFDKFALPPKRPFPET
jgi:hypothetical protein